VKIVNFAIKNDAEIAIFTEHGLLPGGQIDNRQTAMGQRNTRLQMLATLIGAAMKLRLIHRADQVAIKIPTAR
jgi:hypothetical protein